MSGAFPDNRLDGLWEWHPRRDELIVNGRWREIQGLPADPCPRTSAADWRRRLHPDDRSMLENGLRELLEGQREEHEVDVRVRHEDGHWIWVLHRSRVTRLGTDSAPYLYGTLQDITRRKRQESTLRESEHFLGRVGQIAGVGGWQIDLLERRVTWSDETCRLHGRAIGHEPTYEEAMCYFAPSTRRRIRRSMRQAIDTGGTFDLEVPLIRADGDRITIRLIGSADYRNDLPVRVSGAVQDVTDHALRRLTVLGDSHRALERVNERLSLATESGGIGIWDFDVVSGEFVWDEHMYPLYGLNPETSEVITGEHWLELVHPEDRAMVGQAARDAIVLEDGPRELTFRIISAEGYERELYGTARVIRDETGRVVRMVGTNQDITESRRVAAELARQHEILRVTLRSIGDGVITTDPEGHVMWMNPVAETMVGWRVDEAIGRPLTEVFRIVDEETRERAPNPVRVCLDEDRIAGLEGDAVLISRDGQRRWIEDSAAPIRSDEGELFGAVLVFHDVTEQRSIANEMTWRATHDELTGLANRAEFERALTRLHAGCAQDDEHHALLFIDLDRFKIVNDTCGHAAGDQLLRQVSRMLARTVRSCDMLVRLGGDEFAIILERCGLERAADVAQEICGLMDEYRFVHEGQRFRIGTSVGLVPIDGSWPDAAAIIRAADSACYAAKESGRNRVHRWCETDLSLHARRAQTRWATRLETALDEDGFELHAQRIGPLGARSPTADADALDAEEPADDRHAEILIRLRDEGRAPVLPGAFLPAAERFNLIDRIDQWVLGRVIDWLRTHRDRLDVDTLWINLSGQSFGDRRFQEDTLERLRAAGEEVCASLCFEITETAAVTNLDEAAVFVRELRALGVRVALDDFGAGASSFGYLKSLPVDYLKIDGQFVRHLTEDPLDAAAVRCFAEVARVMQVKTVAEFVETPEVLDRLREIGVDFVQGWLLHEPAPIEELLHGPELPALADSA